MELVAKCATQNHCLKDAFHHENLKCHRHKSPKFNLMTGQILKEQHLYYSLQNKEFFAPSYRRTERLSINWWCAPIQVRPHPLCNVWAWQTTQNVETTKEQVHADKHSTKRLQFKDIIWPSPDDDIPFWKQDFGTRLKEFHRNADDSKIPVNGDPDPMHIIHVTAEMAPIAKVGGLGDVVTGLARACIERGHRVEVMLPFYQCIPEEQIAELSTTAEVFHSFHKGDWVRVHLYRGEVSGIRVLLIRPENNFFKGSRIYGGSYDELEAYLFFSRACLEWMQVTGNQPDIIHVHEWQTSALPLLYWDMYHHLSLKKPRIVLTIHNMEHYGECRVEQLSICGLDGPRYRTTDKAIDDRTIGHNPERLSLLKGGIVYSNAVTTVSPTYANETFCSGWMASTLLRHKDKYCGLLNGIDTVLWDPSIDPYLPANYGAINIQGKYICKQYVQRGLGLEVTPMQTAFKTKSAPLVVCITRLVAQKGIHLIRYALSRIDELGGQFIVLGTAPDARVQGEFENFAKQYKESKRIRLLLTYSEALAHMLYAAADIVLVPSMFEPCGLTQMIGMRYGAIPLVRKTGGLADTVFDVDDHSNVYEANGFVFQGIDEWSLNHALERTFQSYCDRPHWWMELVSKVMSLDNSWIKSAGEYVTVYNSVRVKC